MGGWCRPSVSSYKPTAVWQKQREAKQPNLKQNSWMKGTGSSALVAGQDVFDVQSVYHCINESGQMIIWYKLIQRWRHEILLVSMARFENYLATGFFSFDCF
jgi:hypothetical protein